MLLSGRVLACTGSGFYLQHLKKKKKEKARDNSSVAQVPGKREVVISFSSTKKKKKVTKEHLFVQKVSQHIMFVRSIPSIAGVFHSHEALVISHG